MPAKSTNTLKVVWCGVCTGARSQSGTAGSTALTWHAMCCAHEDSYRCDRTVAYVSRNIDTSWGTYIESEAA